MNPSDDWPSAISWVLRDGNPAGGYLFTPRRWTVVSSVYRPNDVTSGAQIRTTASDFTPLYAHDHVKLVVAPLWIKVTSWPRLFHTRLSVRPPASVQRLTGLPSKS